MKRGVFVASGVAGVAPGATRSETVAATLVATNLILIVAGSGPTDRDGNAPGMRPDTYRPLAAALESRGMATIRYDKRGIGAGTAAGSNVIDPRFETYVVDV